MINPIKNNALYIALTAALCVFTYLLNFCTAIYQCALVFSAIATMTNFSTTTFNKKKAISALSFAISLSLLAQWNQPYYINGTLFKGLVFASLTSSMVAIYWSTNIFTKLQNRLGFAFANIIAISVAAVIDGIVMGSYFIVNNNFSYSRILEIFSKEVFFKILYTVIASAIISIVLSELELKKYRKV